MSKKIPLTQGQFAIVDDWNYEQLSKFKWYARWSPKTKSYYALRHDGRNRVVYMARYILGLEYNDKRQVDHIDHNTLDNQEVNLRMVTSQENSFNRTNTKGYSWNKPTRKYQAKIKINGKNIHLGLFNMPSEAHTAYLKAKQKYHRISVTLPLLHLHGHLEALRTSI